MKNEFELKVTDKAMAIYHEHYMGVMFLIGSADNILPLVRERGFDYIDSQLEKYAEPIYSSVIGENTFFWRCVQVEFNSLFKHLDKLK